MPSKKKADIAVEDSVAEEKKNATKKTKRDAKSKAADPVNAAVTDEKPAKKTRSKKNKEAEVKAENIVENKAEVKSEKKKTAKKTSKEKTSEKKNDDNAEKAISEKKTEKKTRKQAPKENAVNVPETTAPEAEVKLEEKKDPKKAPAKKNTKKETATKEKKDTKKPTQKKEKKTENVSAEVSTETVSVPVEEKKPAKKTSKKTKTETKAEGKKPAKKNGKASSAKKPERTKTGKKKAGKTEKENKKKEEKVFYTVDREAVYASVFGYDPNFKVVREKVENKDTVPSKKNQKKNAKKPATKADKKPVKKAEKKTAKKTGKKVEKKDAEKIIPAPIDRDAIFASVFGYDPSFKVISKQEEPKKDVKVVTEPKKEDKAPKTYEKILPYGKITSGKKTNVSEKKKEQPEKETSSSFFGFGKLSSEDIANLRKKNSAPKKDNKAEKKADKKKPAKNKEAAPEKAIEKAQEKTETSKFDRDQIFAQVFGYTISQPVKKAEERKTEQGEKVNKAEGASKAPQKKQKKSTLFKIFKKNGKKKRDGFTAPEKPSKNVPVFNRDEIFAKVFGFELETVAAEKAVAEKFVKPEAKKQVAEKKPAKNTKKNTENPENKKNNKPKEKAPVSTDNELEKLIGMSYTGDYPKTSLIKPLSEAEKRLASSFEDFFKSRGYNLEFSESGATKTGIVTSRIIESGSIINVLDFFNKTKSEISKEICGGDEAFKKFVESSRPFYVIFDASKRKIIETARGFGIVTNVKENTDGTLVVQFSKLPKVIDYFRGGFLESYAYYVARSVAKSVADKHRLSYEIAANAIITDNTGKMVHEYDTMIKLGNIIFIIEEKSSKYFSDFEKFHNDMDELKFNKKNYMILLMNKNSEEMTAIEWFFDFRVANISDFASKLENMLTEAIEELSI